MDTVTDPVHAKDLGSTLAGGGAAMWLLTTVKWEAIPYGECVKLAMVPLLLVAGYFMYRSK